MMRFNLKQHHDAIKQNSKYFAGPLAAFNTSLSCLLPSKNGIFLDIQMQHRVPVAQNRGGPGQNG